MSTNRRSRALAAGLMLLCFLSWIGPFVVMPGQASLDGVSSTYATGGTYAAGWYADGQGDYYNTGGWLYVLGSASSYNRQWKSSADGGETWNTASDSWAMDSATVNSVYRRFMASTTWDPSTNVVYMCHGITQIAGTGNNFMYREFAPTAGVMLQTNYFPIVNSTTNWYMAGNVFLTAATMLNHKPVFAASAYLNISGVSDEVLSVWFATSANPASKADFIQYHIHDALGFPTEYWDVDLHAVNSTTVLLTFHSAKQDSDYYGYFVGYSAGFEDAARFVTLSSQAVDFQKDINNKVLQSGSTVSRNIEDATTYADQIALAYVEPSDRNVTFNLFNVSTRSISVFEQIYNGIPVSADAWDAGVSKYGQNYYVHWANISDADSIWFYLRERDENATWGSTVLIGNDWYYATSGYPAFLAAGTLTNNSRLYFLVTNILRPGTGEFCFWINATGVPEPVIWDGTPPYVTADLENIDDDTIDWVFTDWKYYVFKVNVPNGILDFYDDLETMAIRFNVSTSEEPIQCDFTANSTDWTFNSSMTPALETRFGEPVRLQAGAWINDAASNETDVTFPIWFNDQCLDVYVNTSAIDVQVRGVWLNYTWDWFSGNYSFYLYSKGGFQKNFSTTDWTSANHLQGEEWPSFYAYNGTTVASEIWFRDLQHIKMLPEVQFAAGLETFYIRSWVDYSTGGGVWLPGWKMNMAASYVSYTGIFAGNVWINMTITWSAGTGIPGSYAPTKTDNIYMFYHGVVSGQGDIGRFRFWLDGWFNNINASSTGGGRINAFEFPMVDSAGAWIRWLASNWGVKDDVAKESLFMCDLRDSTGAIMSSEKIKMVRVRMELEVADNDAGQLVLLHNYDVLDYTHSPDLPLTGVQTPVFDDTKLPTVGQTGLLGALFSLFSGLGQWLGENILFGGLNLWPAFVAFLDTIGGYLGAPKAFSNFLAWWQASFGGLFAGFGYAGSVLVGGLTFVALWIGQMLAFIALLFTYLGQVIVGVFGFFTGSAAGAVDVWTAYNLTQWLILAIIIYPLYLIFLWDESGLDAVETELRRDYWILSIVFSVFISLGRYVIQAVNALIEAIPVVE